MLEEPVAIDVIITVALVPPELLAVTGDPATFKAPTIPLATLTRVSLAP